MEKIIRQFFAAIKKFRKLNYFSFNASILQSFLAKYQSDDPLVPFIYDDVLSLITSLMQLVFKGDKVDEAAVKNFKEFDFTLNDNRFPLNSINIDCAVANWIVDLNRRNKIASEEISEFHKMAVSLANGC